MGGATNLIVTEVNGEDAAWMEGEPHVVFVESPQGGVDLPAASRETRSCGRAAR